VKQEIVDSISTYLGPPHPFPLKKTLQKTPIQQRHRDTSTNSQQRARNDGVCTTLVLVVIRLRDITTIGVDDVDRGASRLSPFCNSFSFRGSDAGVSNILSGNQ
jgi:hypothetical protein